MTAFLVALASALVGPLAMAAPVDEALPAALIAAGTPSGRASVALARTTVAGAEPVKLNPELARGTRFKLALPNGSTVVVVRDHLQDLGQGDFVWSGRVEGHPFSRVTFTSRKGTAHGIVDLPWQDGNEFYELVPHGARSSVLLPGAPPEEPRGDDTRVPPVSLRSGGRAVRLAGREAVALAADSGAATAMDPAVVDVMVVYSIAAKNANGGQAAIESKILTAIADANSAHVNSEVHVLFNLVHLAEVDDGGTTDINVALDRLQNSLDGWMDEVMGVPWDKTSGWRGQYKADVVSLVGEYTGAGIGYIMATPSMNFEPYAISAVSSPYLAYYTLHHEIGHNLGCQHDRANASSNPSYPYAYGYKWCATDGSGFRTIMSYDCAPGTGTAPRLNYLSNPNIVVNGRPAGIAYEVDPANSADNARCINLTAPLVQQFRTGTVAPAAPSNLSATATSGTSVNLLWTDNSANEAGFRLERSTDQVTWSVVATLAANLTSFQDAGLTPEATYYYRVRAYNGGGFSAYSNTASVVTTTSPPAAPSGLNATAATADQINLTWTDNATTEQGFTIERSVSGGPWSQVAEVPANSTTWSDAGLTAGVTYSYRLRAYNNLGNSAWSNEASATPQLPPPPAAPTGLTATVVSQTQINLGWTDNSNDETAFHLERSTDGVNFTAVASVGAGVTTFADTGLSAATQYHYRVRASNAGGSSPWSNVASATTLPQPPAAPSGLTATVVSQTQINLGWADNANNETGFKIERSLDGVNFAPIATVGSNVTVFQNTGLTAATTYHYRVRASNSGGDSAPSNVASATTLPNPPSAPSGLTATVVSQTQINLAWADNANNETGFKVERSLDGVNFALIATVGSNVTVFENTGLTAATAYHYRVGATNSGGDSAPSNVASATTLPNPPSAPSGLTATVESQTQINLAWADNANNETGFKVERSLDGTTFSLVATVAANVTTFVNDGLTPDTTYHFRVLAFNAGGESPISNVAVATTLADPPLAPSGLTAAAVAETQINLAWTDNATTEQGFRIEQSGDGVAWSALASVGANVTSYAHAGLTAGTTRYYRVQAFGPGGDSAYSNVAGAVTWTGSSATVTYTSVGAEDGYITESSETSNQGGTVTSTSTSTTALRLGDDSSDRQFRVILSFDTAPLPDTASIVSATLRLRRGGLSGTTPFQTHGTCWVDVKGDTGFGGATGIAAGDFQAAADATRVASLSAASSNGSWSEGAVSAAGLPFVNRTGRTQFRVYFNLDDNDDRGTDYVGYYPGEYSTTSYRPQLVVTYSTIAPTAPVAPVGLTATPVSATQIALAWQDAAGDETGYQLERSTDGVNWFLLASLAANVSAYVDSALAPETSYRYRVRAINGAGNSGWSNVAVATTLADVPPAPSGLTATAGSETQIALTWSDNATNETGYSLERSADGVTWVELIALPANATSHLDAGLPPASTWYYRVRALNAVGASPYSEIATATTWAPNVAPVAADDAYTTPEDTVLVIAAPGLLGNDTDANVEDTLTVVSHSSPAHGTVSVSSNGAFSYSPAPDYHGADSFAYTISDGRGGTASATVALSVLPVADLPAAPTGLTATAISASAINLAWLDEAGNETGFEVERSADGGSQWSLLAVLPANTTAFGDSGLAAGATYLYRVRATNADGPSAWSNVASAATFPPAPGAPSGLVATATSASQIALTWTDNASNESGFRLERSVDALTWTQVAALGSNVVTYTDSGLSSATTYYYRVRAWNAGGDSAWSNLANATTLAPLVTVTFQGLGGEDGFILEASETANTGSTAYASDSNGSAVRSGDNYQDRQYRSIVSFDTSSLPDGATIVSAKLRLRRGALAGTNPFETHGICWVDIKGGSGFNGSSALSKEDFEAPADAARVGTLSNAPTTDAWSEAVIGSAGLPFVNRTGRTQFRFYFDLDDNDDSGTDYIGWYSGENSTADNRPQLVIEYR